MSRAIYLRSCRDLDISKDGISCQYALIPGAYDNCEDTTVGTIVLLGALSELEDAVICESWWAKQ